MVRGCSSAGEHFVDIEGVTGSIPVTPTISSKKLLKQSDSFGAIVLAGLCVLISFNIVFISTRCRHGVETYEGFAVGYTPPFFCYQSLVRYG